MHLRRRIVLIIVSLAILVFAAAYIQWGLFGLPTLPPYQPTLAGPGSFPHGFPAWIRITHFINFLFIILLIRSGLQILADHPRLYWNVHCTPGSEWLGFTPVKVPTDRVWTAKDDARYLSPWIGLPGRRHTIGMARHWHFLSVLFWVVNGAVFVALLFSTNQWQRLVPTSWHIVPQAWATFVHYATFHLPPEPDGFYQYNALQQLAYFGVVLILAPLAILTGPSMSPALTSRYGWYPKLPLNRQIGRSLHFLVMCCFVVFIVMHVSLVCYTGVIHNFNHIVMGTDNANPIGLYLGLVGIAVVVAINVLAHYMAWKQPRVVQHAAKAMVTPIMNTLLNHAAPHSQFGPEDISPYFWANGKVPTSDEWKNLEANQFKEFRLGIYGAVDNPVDLSLSELRAMEKQSQITLHHCIQGWSGIAQWGGVPLADLVSLVKPKSNAHAVIFYSFGEGGEGGEFYDSLSLENAMHPQTLIAYEMNSQPLTSLHGAPLRLRVENQLGFKMVKWIRAIEFVESTHQIYEGEGGYNEDHEYFGELANI